jgi:hypothetical protein
MVNGHSHCFTCHKGKNGECGQCAAVASHNVHTLLADPHLGKLRKVNNECWSTDALTVCSPATVRFVARPSSYTDGMNLPTAV